MAGRDTSRGDYSNYWCSDCGRKGEVCIKHWGPIVPPGAIGAFCEDCWQARCDDSDNGRAPRSLGVMPDIPPPPAT